ncbi:hypothetical protein WJX79_002182 [Trebouxia sp. C0005]
MNRMLKSGQELDDNFTGLADEQGKVKGYRRIFAHTASVFFQRGIARLETGEISSLSCESQRGEEIVVSVFDVPGHRTAIQAFLEREHEFKLVAVQTWTLENVPLPRLSVLCTKWDDETYKMHRCPPEEWARRYTQYGVDRVWRDDVLPCRVYLRHCVLASHKLGQFSYDSFLDHTYLADRSTTIRQYLARNPGIMAEKPPDSLVSRYSG